MIMTAMVGGWHLALPALVICSVMAEHGQDEEGCEQEEEYDAQTMKRLIMDVSICAAGRGCSFGPRPDAGTSRL
jgi:hypothetical protein